MSTRRLPTPSFEDDEGALRLIVPTPAIAELLHLAFDQVRHYGRSDPRVPLVLLEVLTGIGARAAHPGLRRLLFRHAEAVHRASADAFDDELDRQRLEREFANARAGLAGAFGSPTGDDG